MQTCRHRSVGERAWPVWKDPRPLQSAPLLTAPFSNFGCRHCGIRRYPTVSDGNRQTEAGEVMWRTVPICGQSRKNIFKTPANKRKKVQNAGIPHSALV